MICISPFRFLGTSVAGMCDPDSKLGARLHGGKGFDQW